MTFEYPGDWSVVGSVSHGAAGEDVILHDKDDVYRIGIMSFTNKNLQTIENMIAENLSYGRLKKEKFGKVDESEKIG